MKFCQCRDRRRGRRLGRWDVHIPGESVNELSAHLGRRGAIHFRLAAAPTVAERVFLRTFRHDFISEARAMLAAHSRRGRAR